MNRDIIRIHGTAIISALVLLANLRTASAQGTAFTYQGRLMNAGNPANGDHDLRFSLFDDPSAGNQVGNILTNAPTSVSNGLFTVTLDFGAGVFTGPGLWLEIAISPAGDDDFSILSPRQELTSAPYAIRALTAGRADTAADVSAGSVVKSLNTLEDDVTLQAGANVTITPNGNSLIIDAATGGGTSIWSLLNNNAYYTAGSVGIGTNTPASGARLEVNGTTRLTTGGSGGFISIGTPAGETGLGIIGVNRADLRFDGTSVKLLAGPGAGAPGSLNGIVVSTNGNVGIGTTASAAKLHVSGSDDGIFAASTGSGGAGVYGISSGTSGSGIYGVANSFDGEGVHGASFGDGASVNGTSFGNGPGVYGASASGHAGYFAGTVLTEGRISANAGITATASGGPAGSFLGNVSISGNLTVSGSVTKSSGTFKIDHPLDPANKFLSHSFVESPDMMNIYNGNTALDDSGEAIVPLPEWFGSLNKDYRYQLTALGAPGPGLYIAEEIAGNQFKIAGGKPGARVSWQVTGVRQDAFANAHRILVEEEKTSSERGRYLHPELFGEANQSQIGSRP